MKTAVLGWGSLVWDPRELKTAGQFAPNGPLLPVEFCRISADGRLTLAIDETFGAVCTIYSAPSALEALDAAIENLRLREGMPNARTVGFVETASGRQSGVAMQRLKARLSASVVPSFLALSKARALLLQVSVCPYPMS